MSNTTNITLSDANKIISEALQANMPKVQSHRLFGELGVSMSRSIELTRGNLTVSVGFQFNIDRGADKEVVFTPDFKVGIVGMHMGIGDAFAMSTLIKDAGDLAFEVLCALKPFRIVLG